MLPMSAFFPASKGGAAGCGAPNRPIAAQSSTAAARSAWIVARPSGNSKSDR